MARNTTRTRRAAQPEPVADIEAVDKPGMSIDEGIVLFTFFLLAAAITCVVMANQIYN